MISFAVTAYNEMSQVNNNGRNILECILPAQIHDAISEIVIVDDGSIEIDFKSLTYYLDKQPKVSLYRNQENRGVFGNKLEAIARCKSGWVITCDSDNKMDEKFIDKIVKLEKDTDTWYCPSFAKPKFDYRHLTGNYSLDTIYQATSKAMFGCMFNTGNQTVYRDTFMEVFSKYRGLRADLMFSNYLNIPKQSRGDNYWRQVFDANDSFVFNMQWLLAGNSLQVVPDLEYNHYYTSGPESNYIRAPAEKAQLNNVLMAELQSASLKSQRISNGSRRVLNRRIQMP